MKILSIITNPNPILRKKSKNIKLEDIKNPIFSAFLKDFKATMKEKDGVGLAAPQIGQNIRLIVVTDHDKEIIMINPEITKKSWKKTTEEEGCLSVPNFFGEVSRAKKINCQFLDNKGRLKKIQAKDFLARVIQHEIDHLDGILFIDRIK